MPQAFGGTMVTDENQIAPGVIKNIHVNSAAAIISTKISGVQDFLKSIVAGETITAFKAGAIGNNQEEIFLTLATNDGTIKIDGQTANQGVAQLIAGADIAGTVNSVILSLLKQGSPTDNVLVTIHSGTPEGTLLASASMAASSLTTSKVDYTFSLDTPVAMVAGTNYFITILRSGAGDGTNYILLGHSGGGGYSGGSEYVKASGSWADQTTPDLAFTVNRTLITGKGYNAKTTDAPHAAIVSGIFPAAIAAGATGLIQVGGIITNAGWSWTPGQIVYATNTAGTLSHSAGSQSRPIGRALSATEILIDIV